MPFHPTAVKAVNKALVQLGHDVTVEAEDEGGGEEDNLGPGGISKPLH